MGQIQIKYDEVYAKTAELRNYISNDLLTQIENEYGQIQSLLNRVDGATNASLKEDMERNREKSIKMAEMMDKLLSFMANSSRQIELNEQIMANTILHGAKQGGTE